MGATPTMSKGEVLKMIIIYKEVKNGKIELTKKELEDLLKQAEQEGYARGCANHYTYTPPIVWGTDGTKETKPYWSGINEIKC